MNSIIKKAFESLTVTCKTTSLHPTDEDRIKVTLKALHKNGITIDTAILETWLSDNGWAQKPIKDIVKWASSVTTGGRVQLKSKVTAPNEKEVWKRLNA